MTDDRPIDRAARRWLEEGPTQAPDRAVDAALSRIQSIQQERDLRIPWRYPRMNPIARLAIVAAVLAVAVGVAVVAFRPMSSVGPISPTQTPPPTPAPTVMPSPNVITFPTPSPTPRPPLTPLSYSRSHTSTLYHYSARYPATWTLEAGTDPNDPDTIPDIGVGRSDFYGDGVASGVMVTSARTSSERPDLAAWTPFITLTIEQQYGTYLGIGSCIQSSRTLVVDGVPANEVDFICPDHDWLWVTTVRGGRAYQIAWLDDGGFTATYLRPFLDQFLAGFTFTK